MATKIKAVITDVDGCLTNGAIYQFRSGDIARQFSTLDGRGFSLLHENGIKTAIVTSAAQGEQEIIDRANWLNVEHVYMNARNKAELLNALMHPETTIQPQLADDFDSVAYFGNDTNDLEAMKLCGFAGCPSDAHYAVRDYCGYKANYISRRKGGQGAFREFAEYIIGENQNTDT